jgi:site-specific recombinase XerD
MTGLAPTLQAFFTDRLTRQRQASAHTVAAYRDALKLLVAFAADRTGRPPSGLDIADLNAEIITSFLDHLQHERANAVSTRNARLAAIRSLFRFAALRHPEHAATIEQVLAIPTKRSQRTLISYLTDTEVEALLTAPDRNTWVGRRDHTLLTLAIQTGLRASELLGLRRGDLHLGTGAHVACRGKGRKDRITPLTAGTIAVVRAWLAHSNTATPATPLFTTVRGTQLSRDALERRLSLYVTRATKSCPALRDKTVTAHVLRHTTAMRLLHAGVDTSVIALWLGHENVETTQIYLHADMAIKEKAINRTTPIHAVPGRYRPTDQLLAFLEGL